MLGRLRCSCSWWRSPLLSLHWPTVPTEGGDQSGSLPPRSYVKLLNQHSMLKIVRISKIRVMRTLADYIDKVLLGVQPAQTARENKEWAQNGSSGRNHLTSVSTLKRQWKTEKFSHFFHPCGTGQTGHWTLDTGHTLWRRAHAKMNSIGLHRDKERGHWSMQRCCLPVIFKFAWLPQANGQTDVQYHGVLNLCWSKFTVQLH